MQVATPRQLAYALNEQLALELTAQPWNRFQPDATFWWLVPATDWPAYRFGKYAFSLIQDAPRRKLWELNDPRIETDAIFAGFNLERGYGLNAVFVDSRLKNSPQIVDSTWLWHELTESPGADQFDKALKDAAKDASLSLYVTAGYVHDRESGLPSSQDAVMFRVTSSGLTHVLNNKFPIPILAGCETATDFVTLAKFLQAVDEYYWLDIYVGEHVLPGKIDVTSLYRRSLKPFRTWLR